MTRLRDALSDLAQQAPPVSLADAVITRHRARRRRRLALATVAAAAVLATAAGAVTVWPSRPDTVATQTQHVTDLPPGQVGAARYAYLVPCGDDCGTEWRVVTPKGTYRIPQALTTSKKAPRVPIAISRNGRMLAYYSPAAGAHVIRDLVGGEETISPVKVPEQQIGIGSLLAVSDDGRHLVFDPREGGKQPSLLIDVRTGRTRSIPGAYEVVGIKDGTVALVRYRKTDLWLMPVIGGGEPVRFDGAFIMFSDLAPDGRTIAAVDTSQRGTLTLLDARTGRTLRELPLRGLPAGSAIHATGSWLNQDEVITVVTTMREPPQTYAAHTRTGRTRHLTTYQAEGDFLTLPGLTRQLPMPPKTAPRE